MGRPDGERFNLRRDSVHPRKSFDGNQTRAKSLGAAEDDQGDGRGKGGERDRGRHCRKQSR